MAADINEMDIFANVPYEHSLFAHEIPTTEGLASVDELANRYYDSVYGREMDSQPYRFIHPFGYEREQMLADLGEDVLPLGHQKRTGMFVAAMIEEDNMVDDRWFHVGRNVATLLFAASIHDLGESLHPEIAEACGEVVGDIPAGQKTERDRRLEANVRATLYERIYPDVSEGVLQDVEAIISHRDNSTVHQIYDDAHVLQTYTTGMLARKAYVVHQGNAANGNVTRSPDALEKLQSLADTVRNKNTGHSVILAWRYAFASRVLAA